MFEIFVGDVVYYTTPDLTLARDTIKSIVSQKQKGRVKHMCTLCGGLIKPENELFLSLRLAKAHFERCKLAVSIPQNLEID